MAACDVGTGVAYWLQPMENEGVKRKSMKTLTNLGDREEILVRLGKVRADSAR
jgi:hypothetical protein